MCKAFVQSFRDHAISIGNGHVSVRCYGAADAPQILVLGGISGGRDIFSDSGFGWWQGLAAALPDSVGVISLDYPGGSGASDIKPVPDRVEHHAECIEQALRALGVTHLQAVVGGSFGGVVALELVRRSVLSIAALVVIGAAHRPTAQALMLRALQREYITVGEQTEHPNRGVQLARALAMLSYRSAEGMDTYHPQGDTAVDYILSRSAQTVAQAPERARNFFVAFGPALDHYRISPTEIKVPTLLIGFESDQLVSPKVLAECAESLPQCGGLHIYPSTYGHDGFIKNTESYAHVCRSFLEQQ